MKQSIDVLVVGGGVAGVAAAVSSAREGARTLIVERNAFFGGAATAAAVVQFMGWKTFGGDQVIAGFGQELVDRLIERGGSKGADYGLLSTGMHIDRVVFDPDVLKVVMDEMVLESGAEPLFHSMISGVERLGKSISKVRVLTKSGEIEFFPRVVVDCSGELEVLHRADCEMLPLEAGEQLQPASLYFKMGPADLTRYGALSHEERSAIARKGVEEGALGRLAISCYPVPDQQEAWFNVTRISVDGTDAEALSRAEIEGRRQALTAAQFIAANVPGFEKARLTGFAPQLGIRETRRIRGRIVVNEEDLREGRRFDDAVAVAAFPIDVHDSNGADVRLDRVGGDDHVYFIPLRSLIPVSVDNALVAGRGVSATHAAFGALRIMPQAMAMGQAAGVTAALAAQRNGSVAELPYELVRAALERGGAILSPPPRQAGKNVSEN